MKIFLTLLLLGMVTSAQAACPALPDRSAMRAALLETLAQTTAYSDGIAAAGAVWQFWRDAPDEAAKGLLFEGVEAIQYGDLLRAEERLRRLVDYCPDYAEGYNQLAFALFLQERDAESLDMLHHTLMLEPAHFGALAGIALIHFRAEKHPLGQIFLRRAVAINPWLNERGLLVAPIKGDTL
jgi:tetratricopeptide (TPR) repeat protein